MSCMTVELPNSLRWFKKAQGFEFNKSSSTNMSCIVASATGSPVLGSCRSPSVVVGLHDEIELCTGSPLRSPLNGFQTPKGVRIGCKDGGLCRSPMSLSHEFDCCNGGVSPLKVRHAAAASSSSFLRSSSSSPTQENLGYRGHQNIILGSRLRDVLAARDVNHLGIENGSSSPVKKTQQKIVPVPVTVCNLTVRVDDGCEDFEKGEVAVDKKPPSPPLKRKRPPRLDIPQSTSLEALPLNKEQPPKEITMEGSHYAIVCKKGRREYMEDTHKAMVNLQGDSKQAFFGVFDGHGGRKAADFAAENIGHNIMDALAKVGDQQENIVQAVRAGYLATDAEFLKQGVSSGTSCVTALIKDGNMVVSNAGDCRAVISRDGHAEGLTSDHRAAREDERERIENSGGYVDCRHGVWRVQGVLAISRGIGDLHMKDYILAEPDTKKIEIESDCEFLIMASDGLWDKVTNQEAVDLARPFCIGVKPSVEPSEHVKAEELVVENSNLPVEGPLAACRKLVELSVARGSLDDVSVMIVQLGNFCKRMD
ncbi:probable protein phosphatase 2C 2 [Cryptomeria japonica]|uniref:probable protein phosphatase 2C 2 n=1 Tax=Cryptomeria japonica TaxID=3369 RepID=UPI0025AD5C19|nr:probable protein phosphatase 2C 2 [Cryptomeria japonica]